MVSEDRQNMHLWPLKSGLWSHKTGWSLKSGPIYKKNYWCIQIVVIQERWSLNSGVSDDRFYCNCINFEQKEKNKFFTQFFYLFIMLCLLFYQPLGLTDFRFFIVMKTLSGLLYFCLILLQISPKI